MMVPARDVGRPAVLALLLGALAALAEFLGSWIPSFWGDEAASVLSAERNLPSLFALLGHVDAVHGAYYVLLHFWIGVFGASATSVRLPSAIAAGFAVAGTFRIADLLATRAIGISAALVCMALPSIDFFAAEARSYSIATAVAVWVTFVFVDLLRRADVRVLSWIAYGVFLGAGIYVFLYLGLLIPAHLAFLLGSRSGRAMGRRFALAVVAAAVLAAPLVAIGYQQRDQVSFLSHRRHLSLHSILVYQWLGNDFLAAIAWLLVLVAGLAAIVAFRRRREIDQLAFLALVWMLVPVLLLFALGVITPTYDLRYVSFGAPALAILVALGIARAPRRSIRVSVLACVLGLALPTDVGQRGPNAYNASSDWSRAGAIIHARAHPGDAVVFDATTRPSQRPRLAFRLYPADFAGLKDVELKRSFQTRTTLWDSTRPISEVSGALRSIHTVWLLEETDTPDSDAGTNIFALRALGYIQRVVGSSGKLVVYRFTKAG